MLKTKLSWILLPALLLAFSFGVAELFLARFERGDIYPVYSSLRADPLGTKAYYDGLNKTAGVTAARNYQSVRKLRDEGETTFFCFGLRNLELVNEEDVKILESMARSGGRVVMSLYPETRPRPQAINKDGTMKEKKKEGSGEDDRSINNNRQRRNDGGKMISLEKRWNFSLNDDSVSGDSSRKAVPVSHEDILKEPVLWHSSRYFEKSDLWEGVYAVDGRNVMIERKLGKGTIVLSTDTFFASNEAMRRERHPDLLAWLVGKSKRAVFDETHFGIHENPGIAALTRRYRLHGLYAGIVLMAILFVWKNAFSLVPPRKEISARPEKVISSKDYISGLVCLLLRNISPDDIAAVCFKEWDKTFRFTRRASADDLKKIQEIVESGQRGSAGHRNPLETYRRMRTILSERKYIWIRN